MDIRRAHFILFVAAFLLAGCGKKTSAANTPSASPAASRPLPAVQTIARFHWLGMAQIARETNAASLMAVWNLPESRKLEQQTLDKLSLAPWRLLHRQLDTNAALLRPLLNDVVSNESCLEIRGATNQPKEMAFAIRLSDRRAALWQTNLAQVLESLTGIHPVPAPGNHSGWSLKKHHAPNLIELTRAKDWTIVGAAQNQNGLMAELESRIQRGQSPVTVGNTNDWLAADLNPAQLMPDLKILNPQPSTLKHFSSSVTGNGSNVLTHATADFSEPLALDLKPWNIPTNLIDKHVCSFTVIRGFKPWLASSKFWQDLQIGPPPDQICFWAEQGQAMLSYFVAPLPDASNEVDRFTDWALRNEGRWLSDGDLGKFERSKKFNGLQWRGLPYMWPFLRSITTNNQNFIYAGGMLNAVASPFPLKTMTAVLNRTNLVYHDAEITGPRIGQWIYMGQFARFVSGRAQLPSDSPSLLWLKAIAPKLGGSVTDITQTGPNQLSFTRRSGIGLTAIELNLLADWLESPEFPIGLHTFKAPPPVQP